jgi:hypothetical protein
MAQAPGVVPADCVPRPAALGAGWSRGLAHGTLMGAGQAIFGRGSNLTFPGHE